MSTIVATSCNFSAAILASITSRATLLTPNWSVIPTPAFLARSCCICFSPANRLSMCPAMSLISLAVLIAPLIPSTALFTSAIPASVSAIIVGWFLSYSSMISKMLPVPSSILTVSSLHDHFWSKL